MMEVTTKCLGQICDEGKGIIRTGPFGTQLHQSDYEEDGTPVIMPKNIISGKVSTEKIARVGEQNVLRLSQHRLEVGDIVYGRRGDIGRHAFIRVREYGWLCGTGCLRISIAKSVLDPRYLHYYLDQEDVIDWITKQAVGATMPNLNTSILRSVPVTFPHIPTQRKIAAILSAYDDLIENNMQRIKILEEMAQNLYREWFVKFRFPGHQNLRFTDSPIGQIPEGWDVKGAMGNTNWSFLHQSIGPYEGVKRYYATADIEGITITGDGVEYAYDQKPSRAQKQPLLYSVWFARMQDTYKVLPVAKPNTILATNSMLSSGFAGFKTTDEESFAFLFLTINSKEFHSEKDRYCTGATQRSLTNEGLSRILTISPPREIVRHFGHFTMSFVDLILALQLRNQVLRRTRDLLLPRLISGEVDVSVLDIAVPEEAKV